LRPTKNTAINGPKFPDSSLEELITPLKITFIPLCGGACEGSISF